MKKLLVILAVCIISGCSTTTQITGSWARPGARDNTFTNIMVLALVGENNPRLQQSMEENLVSDLRKKGYLATSYFDAYGPVILNKSDEREAIAMLSKDGEDAIITIVLLDTAKEADYKPGLVDYGPHPAAYHFWGYYVDRCTSLDAIDYYTIDTHYFLESNLYSAKTEDLLYSVRTESFDPQSAEKLANQYDHTILRDMIVKQVIHPQ